MIAALDVIPSLGYFALGMLVIVVALTVFDR